MKVFDVGAEVIGKNIMFDTQKKIGESISVWYLDFHHIDKDILRFGIVINDEVKIGDELLFDIFDERMVRPTDKVKNKFESVVYKHLGSNVAHLWYGPPQEIRGAYGGVLYVGLKKEEE